MAEFGKIAFQSISNFLIFVVISVFSILAYFSNRKVKKKKQGMTSENH